MTMPTGYNRRRFLSGLAALAASSLVPFPTPAQAKIPPELADFTPLRLRGGSFTLHAWLRPGKGEILHVFIAGDGPVRGKDPTPRHAISALLAADMPRSEHVLYLARPGQYASSAVQEQLDPKWWTSHRYAPEMAQAVSDTAQEAQRRCSLSRLALYGHSGGGALAVLAAPSLLPSLCCLGTVASPLDTELWTRLLGTKPLAHSLNPKNMARRLLSVPQLHLTGGRDTVVPFQVLDSWLSELQPLPPWIRRVMAPAAGHQGPWLQAWRVAHAALFPSKDIASGIGR
jgi:hypothetical protein